MSKYTDMMDEAAFECLDEAHINEREGNDKVAELERSKSADWRAMRKAWEAMVEACEEALIEIGYSMNPSGIVIDKLDTALAKARGE